MKNCQKNEQIIDLLITNGSQIFELVRVVNLMKLMVYPKKVVDAIGYPATVITNDEPQQRKNCL